MRVTETGSPGPIPITRPQLDAEVRNYRLKDEGLRQDAVMALAIAVEHASAAHDPHRDEGRILGVVMV
jgi:hypothetical protein